ncbi:MAG: penicillin-binding protein 1B [Gammaproteobacteria bacterium]
MTHRSRRGPSIRAKATSSARRSPPPLRITQRGRQLGLLLKLSLALAVALSGYLIYLHALIVSKFEGKRWALPAHVYARPLELYPGMRLGPGEFEEELRALGYRLATTVEQTGEYHRLGSRFEIRTRGFPYVDGTEPPRNLRIHFQSERIQTLEDLKMRGFVGPVRLEPMRIGGIYPAHHEDRVLVRIDQVPPLLIDALIAMEDKEFYDHHGISWRGIARALWVNVKAGGVVQGGSTLTQQLVKNYFLTSERSLWRKIQEALMAILLELRYEKADILEAYLNEVHLGQDGNRAIHGFGLASSFYFGRPLTELQAPELALLVALVRGPSYYNPRRHAERARERRNRVLAALIAQETLADTVTEQLQQAPLGVTPHPPGAPSPYPAFMDLIRRQLQSDYREEDLTSEGLQIYTTLDPRTQRIAEEQLKQQLAALEHSRDFAKRTLEGAVVVTSAEDGEVLAVVGGRNTRLTGFNRALDSARPIGSLVKPAIYLTALASGQYTLATPLDDAPLRVGSKDGRVWEPQNYDRQSHGLVPLHTALARSYNLATARLGMSLGVPEVIDTLHRLGIERRVSAYPAVLLGAVSLSPVEVAQMYQTLAAGGFRIPLRAIRDVFTADGTPLKRYELAIDQVVNPSAAFLITTALQEVVRSGTAQSLIRYIPRKFAPAGKTGTTDGLRDSWFAGFTGNHLAVVWIGRDDNRPSQLTGAQGALTVWGATMQALGPDPLVPVQPPDIQYVWVDPQGRRATAECDGSAQLPFAQATMPSEASPCLAIPADKSRDTFIYRVRELFR